MISFRSVNFYLLLFLLVSLILKIFGLINFTWGKFISYALMFWGISFFYNSFLKKYHLGIFSGALLFQMGAVLFSATLFELLEPEKIFFPAALAIIGFALLFTNLVGNMNKFVFVLSIIFISAGILLLIFRGNITLILFLESAYQLLKNFWIILLISLGIIFLATVEFRNGKKNQRSIFYHKSNQK